MKCRLCGHEIPDLLPISPVNHATHCRVLARNEGILAHCVSPVDGSYQLCSWAWPQCPIAKKYSKVTICAGCVAHVNKCNDCVDGDKKEKSK